jgi:hypothetical protein
LARQITEAFPWDTAFGAAFKTRVRVVPMAVIARQLGHSDTRMTERPSRAELRGRHDPRKLPQVD